jgi:uncharacterized membrane protein YphA (DoxX/SURF4 family)
MADLAVFVGVALVVSGIYLLAGLPVALVVAGLFFITVGILAALREGQHEPDKQTTDTDSA